MAIECRTAEHTSAKANATLAIILYPVGIFTLNAALLFRERNPIRSKRKTSLTTALGFLHREFQTDFFWWDPKVCARVSMPGCSQSQA